MAHISTGYSPEPAVVRSVPNLHDLRAAVRESPRNQRVNRIEVNGQRYWIKRRERLSLRWRLQKGDPGRAFERERQGLRQLRAIGLPVPPIVDEGQDYFVTPDAGVPLDRILRCPEFSGAEREVVINAAVRALHKLHEAGVAHGRPNLKDMLWDGRDITLIDFERFGKVRHTHTAQVLDFIIFALSCFAVVNHSLPQIDQALHLYRTLDMRGVFDSACRYLNWMRWLNPVARWLQKIRVSREIVAISRLFDWLRRWA